MKSLFIVFEGIDGSGKSTLSKNVFAELIRIGIPVWLGHEPTSFPPGLKIRQFLKNEISLSVSEQLELFIEDRKLSVANNILPNLQKGNHVILDRYFYSTAAYQASAEFSAEKILQMNLAHGFPVPDLLFYLEIAPSAAMQRIGNRGEAESFEKPEILTRISTNYEKILGPETIRLDALKPPEELVRKAVEKIQARM